MTGAADALWRATVALHESGRPLMQRVLPARGEFAAWQHYPVGGVVNGPWQARWYYHAHARESAEHTEHGHFHLFVGRKAFPRAVRPAIIPPDRRRPRPSAVHLGALSIGLDGLPLAWFATNRWVTDEWLYPAGEVARRIPDITFAGDDGDPLVNDWLTAMLHASRASLAALLAERDALLLAHDPAGEDRAVEVVAQSPIDLDLLLRA